MMKLKMRVISPFAILFVAVLPLLFVMSCERKEAPQLNQTFPVVAEVQPLCYYVDAIMGAKVCTPLFPPTVSPEVYELKPSDLALLDQGVSLFFYVSTLGNEVTMKKLMDAYPDTEFVDLVESYPSININAASCIAEEGIPLSAAVMIDDHGEEHTLDDGHDHDEDEFVIDPAVGEYLAANHFHTSDPHLWLSMSRGGQIVATVGEALRRTYPFLSTTIDANGERLAIQLEYKYTEIQTRIADAGIKGFAIYHPSLNYYADDYNICYLALENMGKSPVPQTVERVIEEAKNMSIRTVFVQEGFPKRDLDTLAGAINGYLVPFDPMGYDVMKTMDNITDSLIKRK